MQSKSADLYINFIWQIYVNIKGLRISYPMNAAYVGPGILSANVQVLER